MDVDPGVDDSLALLLAARSPEVELVGVTTVFGNHTVATTTRNALDVLALAGRADICVAAGAAGPLASAFAGPRRVVHGDNGLGNASLKASPARPLDVPAYQFIIDTARRAPGLTLVAVAALTNLALALAAEPRLPDWIAEVILMGGAYARPGNITPYAEANIYHDPDAARAVFDAPWRVTAVGLDVTLAATLDEAAVAGFAAVGTPAANFVASALPSYQRFYRERYGQPKVPIHDAVTIAHLIDPTLLSLRATQVDVDTGDGPTRGQTRATFLDQPAPGVPLVATAIDAPRFRELLLARVR